MLKRVDNSGKKGCKGNRCTFLKVKSKKKEKIKGGLSTARKPVQVKWSTITGLKGEKSGGLAGKTKKSGPHGAKECSVGRGSVPQPKTLKQKPSREPPVSDVPEKETKKKQATSGRIQERGRCQLFHKSDKNSRREWYQNENPEMTKNAKD